MVSFIARYFFSLCIKTLILFIVKLRQRKGKVKGAVGISVENSK